MIALFLIPLYILVNAYAVRWMLLWMGSCHHLFQSMPFRILFIGIYIFLATTLLTGFLIKKPFQLHHILKSIGNYFLGMFLYILMTIITADLIHLILKYGFHTSWVKTQTAFIISGFLCTMIIVILSIHGILNTYKLKIHPYEVTIDKDVQQMDSLKIVLLADLHFGHSVNHHHAARIVRKINQQHPDLVCIAGDIFDNDYDAISDPNEITRCLKSIQTRYGVYACWGNHDLNEPILAGFTFKKTGSPYEDPRMEEMLKKADIRLLNDESVLIDHTFYLIGRKDPSRCKKTGESRKTPDQLTKELDRRKPIIFMDHQPKELQEISYAGADLDLCGHTHDGQIFPGNLTTHFIWENSCGYLKKDNMHNIVTSGAGVWGPNMRIGTNNEICSITVYFQSDPRPCHPDPEARKTLS